MSTKTSPRRMAAAHERLLVRTVRCNYPPQPTCRDCGAPLRLDYEQRARLCARCIRRILSKKAA